MPDDPGDNTQVLTIGLLDRFETGQSIGYHRAATGNMPFAQSATDLVLKPSTTVIRILIDVLPLIQGHCCHKRRLACRAPTPFATTGARPSRHHRAE